MKKIAAYFAFLMLLSGICSCGKAKTSEGPAPVYGNFSSSDASAGNSKAAAPEPSTDRKPSPSKPESAKEAHTHSFSAATCSSAAVCACGVTSGEKAQHTLNESTGKCSVCGYTEFNLKNALSVCVSRAEKRFSQEFKTAKIINTYYSESDNCICTDIKPDNKITVFIHYRYTLEGYTDYNIDIYDVHLTENGYEPYLTYSEALTVPKGDGDIKSVTIKSRNISYSGNALKKADLQQ